MRDLFKTSLIYIQRERMQYNSNIYNFEYKVYLNLKLMNFESI